MAVTNGHVVAPMKNALRGRTGRRPTCFLPFSEARNVVRAENLQSVEEWWKWVKNNKADVVERWGLPVPTNPQRIYSGCGWVGFRDFLGYGRKRLKHPGLQENVPQAFPGQERYAQRVAAVDFFLEEMRQDPPYSRARSKPIVDFRLLPISCRAPLLYRIRNSDFSESECADSWSPLLLRSAKGGAGGSPPDDQHYVFWRCRDKNSRVSRRTLTDATCMGASKPSPSDGNTSNSQLGLATAAASRYFPLICVVPDDRKFMSTPLAWSVAQPRRPANVAVSKGATTSAEELRKMLHEHWNSPNCFRMSLSQSITALMAGVETRARCEALMRIREDFYEPAGLTFEFSSAEQTAAGPYNSFVGPYRVLHRKATSDYRVKHRKSTSDDREAESLKRYGAFRAHLETARCPGFIFGGKRKNIHCVDFLVIFHGATRTSNVDGIWVIPRSAIIQNICPADESAVSSMSMYLPDMELRNCSARVALEWQTRFYIDLGDRSLLSEQQSKLKQIFQENGSECKQVAVKT
ncbi:unnamed protein product [Amoebophrya sp. A25]|nr:unnamed protein product [Amoebophrya sp. A25]|eukprot:GSA25T00008479001.1